MSKILAFVYLYTRMALHKIKMSHASRYTHNPKSLCHEKHVIPIGRFRLSLS